MRFPKVLPEPLDLRFVQLDLQETLEGFIPVGHWASIEPDLELAFLLSFWDMVDYNLQKLLTRDLGVDIPISQTLISKLVDNPLRPFRSPSPKYQFSHLQEVRVFEIKIQVVKRMLYDHYVLWGYSNPSLCIKHSPCLLNIWLVY